MINIKSEIKTNYYAYTQTFVDAVSANSKVFKDEDKLIESYARVAALNALKVDLVDAHFAPGAAHFFFEAHNDALLSHSNASFGSWRPALQSLRSFLENTLSAIYFSDHPVELEKWTQGKFVIQPRELREYVSEHPKTAPISAKLDLRASLDKEYRTLSKAVHGSSHLFRMTSADGKINIASATLPELGKWAARERATIDLCVLLLACILQEHLDGAKLPNLRDALSVTLQPDSRAALKDYVDIRIPAP